MALETILEIAKEVLAERQYTFNAQPDSWSWNKQGSQITMTHSKDLIAFSVYGGTLAKPWTYVTMDVKTSEKPTIGTYIGKVAEYAEELAGQTIAKAS